jgi:pilus assembly protein Flp/PilA
VTFMQQRTMVELMTRLVSTYFELRETARRHLERGLSGRQAGQGMVEYGLILVLIAVVVVLILSTVGKRLNNAFSNVSNALGT